MENELIDNIADSLSDEISSNIIVEDVSVQNSNKKKWLYPISMTLKVNFGDIEIVEPDESDEGIRLIKFNGKTFTEDEYEEAVEYIKSIIKKKLISKKGEIK